MFLIGLNPYGVAFTVGLQGTGTARANPEPIGLDGFIRLARDAGAQCIELDHRWLTPRTEPELKALGATLADVPIIVSFWLQQVPGETLEEAVRCARALGAALIRCHLTPVVEGARAALGPRWAEMVAHARNVLRQASRAIADAGLALAIEDHQDFGSEELVALSEELGDHVGVVLDTGNPYAVGEDPVAFTARAAHRIRHVHLKDYVAQFTDEGYRLVRCPVGDGCVPFAEIAEVLGGGRPLTASIEIGALDARHIRAFTGGWWEGYPPRDARELGIMIGRLRRNALGPGDDYRTPWERHLAPGDIASYEVAQLRRSVENVRRWNVR